jgi:hypothetical protein
MEYLPIVSIIVSVLGLVYIYFAFVVKISERMTKVEARTDLFWKVVENNVGQILKSSTHTEKDVLLDKLAHRELDTPEVEKLRGILTDEMQLLGRRPEVVGYALIIGRLEQLLLDLRGKKK